MPVSAEEYFTQEVIKSARTAKKAIQAVSDLNKSIVKAEMHKLNDTLHKSGYPITHMHLKKSINNGGKLRHVETSRAASAVLASPELKKLAQKNADSCFKARLLFKSNRDLTRAFHEATIQGEIAREGKNFKIRATLVDTFDFRFAWVPKNLTLKGAKLRLAGNIAYVAQEMGLLKPVKLSVDLVGFIK